jgi:predicted component of type VI protein secretion system
VVQLQILTGAKAGTSFTNSRLPLQIGRAADADLSVEEAGIWPRHFHIERQGLDLVCQAEANALLYVNGAQTNHAALRNGDIISIGALKMQFALSPVRQSSLRPREALVWAALAFLCLAQVYVAFQLIR